MQKGWIIQGTASHFISIHLTSSERADDNLSGYCKQFAGQIPLQKLLRILLQISNGMSYLHSKKLVHRDLKGDNVLVVNETFKIGDLQLATCVGDYYKISEKTKSGFPGYQVNITLGPFCFLLP
jgi:serine/threonine protein kinase